jgi:hypothetical protein
MKVLALDIATSCGVCFGEAGAVPHAWAIDLGKGCSDAARFAKAIRMTRHYCAKFKPDLVAVEAPIGGPQTSHLLVGMWACVTGEIENAGIPPMKCNIGAVRKHFLGRPISKKDFPGFSAHKAKLEIKKTVMNRGRALGWTITGHDAADAAATWDYACATHDTNHHTTTIGGLFNERRHPT